MHTKGPKEEPLADLGYETRDIDTKTIERAVMWFFTFATVMFVTGAWIYANINPAFTPSVIAQKEDLRIPKPPNPLLQDNASNFTDIMKLRAHETQVLTSTGWTDSSHTFAHIPIDDAINILSTRGLPQTNSSVPAVTKGNTTDESKPAVAGQAPGDRYSNSGRTSKTTPSVPAVNAPKPEN